MRTIVPPAEPRHDPAIWCKGNGNKVAFFAGVAAPRNPTEPGPRHLEDVVEVIYEEMVQGLEKAQGVETR
jgi:hypothetical protein